MDEAIRFDAESQESISSSAGDQGQPIVLGTPSDERLGSENSADGPDANARAVLAHNLIAWQEEAERWRRVAHAQRARITELERAPTKILVRDLISALEESRAFVLHADSRWQHDRKTRALDLLDQILQRGKKWLHGPG